MRVLLVKTSSLGDVVHALPAVTDASLQGVTFDWVVEEAFADLPAMHPAVDRVIPIAWRRWRRSLRASREQMRRFAEELRSVEYDLVLDSQGLMKSAAVSLLARGRRAGFSHTTAREPWAAFAYGDRHMVARGQHAIDRQRQLFAAAFDYPVPLETFSGIEQMQTRSREVVLLHGTTWATKHWPLPMWQALAAKVVAAGLTPVVTWGNDEEAARARRIAEVDGVQMIDRLPLADLAERLARAALVVGVDSGLAHLSAALGTPTLGLYGPTDAVLTGCRGGNTTVLQASTPCAPCLDKQCRRYAGEPVTFAGQAVEPPCFATLNPDRVWQAAEALL